MKLSPRRGVCGISSSFPELFPTQGQVTHVLLTRSPLSRPPKGTFSFDLHVLGAPPALILSRDQTLEERCLVRDARRASGQIHRVCRSDFHSESDETYCTSNRSVKDPCRLGSTRQRLSAPAIPSANQPLAGALGSGGSAGRKKPPEPPLLVRIAAQGGRCKRFSEKSENFFDGSLRPGSRFRPAPSWRIAAVIAPRRLCRGPAGLAKASGSCAQLAKGCALA